MKSLTAKEEEIMNHFWENGDMKISELHALYKEPRPHVNTLGTLVKILEEKGFVGHKALSPRNFRYFAKVGHLIEDKADETWNHRRLLRLQIGTPEQPIVLPDTDSEVIGFNPWVDEWIDGGRILVNF